jgi:hypothetical protein
MKVYVVGARISEEETGIVAVCSSMELAQRAKAQLVEKEDYFKDNCWVEIHEIDQIPSSTWVIMEELRDEVWK